MGGKVNPMTRNTIPQEKIKKSLQKAYPELAKEFGVKKLGLFGSYAKGTAVESTSDVDLVVEFSQPIGLRFVEFAERLEQLLGNKVDILTTEAIQGIRIPHIAKEIQDSIVYV